MDNQDKVAIVMGIIACVFAGILIGWNMRESIYEAKKRDAFEFKVEQFMRGFHDDN